MDKVFFVFNDILNDQIIDIDGIALPNPILPKDWVYNNLAGDWWIELGRRGTAVLCTNLPLFTDMTLGISSASGNYNVVATSNFIGSRPDDSIRK